MAGRVLLTLFQQSYKGFKKNFFKVRCNRRDPSLLDGFPLYWIEKPNLQRVRRLEDLSTLERGVCELLSEFTAPLSTLELLKREYSLEDLESYIGIPSLSCFLFCYGLACILLLFACFILTCFYYTDMRLSEDKKRKLADLLPKQRAATIRTGLSIPLAPSTSIAPTSQPTNPAPTVGELRRVLAVESDDEDTCIGLVFKRPRVGTSVVPSASVSAGAPTFIDHSPSASSPLPAAALEGGGESATRSQEMDSPTPLPLLLRQALSRFQSCEAEGLDDILLQERVANVLGDLLFGSNRALARTQAFRDLEAKMVKLEDDFVARAKVFANRETALYLEMASLRQTEKDAKKALQDKSLEAVELEAKILPLRTRTVELNDIVAELKGKVADLESRGTQREILLGQVEGELVEKTESFRRAEEELMNDAATAYDERFQDAVAQFTCAYPEVDPSLFDESKCVVDGQIVPRG